MKNLLNCHSIGLHSFPLSFEDGLYKRVFIAEEHHNLWKPFEIAVHPHHVDIKITVLEGTLMNPIYELSADGGILVGEYKWNSHILNGNGGFELIRPAALKPVSIKKYCKGKSVTMKACELHTVFIEKGKKCAWMIEETVPTCEYIPLNYSIHNLTKWTPEGLYCEVGEEVKQKYLKDYDL